MAELLLEVGCEELPASSVRQAYEELAQKIVTLLEDSDLDFGMAVAMGTPRRLIVAVADVQDKQKDSSVEQRGPSAKAAYDADGNPTKALEGFCRGQGIDISTVEVKDDYVWVTKEVKGDLTSEILAKSLPEIIGSLTFKKTMRWGDKSLKFARPVRWILSTFDHKVVPFEFAGVKSDKFSFGHRFNSPEKFEATNFNLLLEELRKRDVEPSPTERQKRIISGCTEATSGKPELSEALIDENTFLTEWPTVHEGKFDEKYLDLPEPVLVTAMAKHERFFPVRDNEGTITNKFLSVRNSGDEDKVRAGNEWVLNARFNDAQFFYEEDCKQTLDWFLNQTERMLYQEKLGTIRQKASRLEELTRSVALSCGADEVWASQAGLFAKADLSTGLVNELSSLQGIVGGHYAQKAGLSEAVCHAISTQYHLAKNLPADTPEKKLGVCLTVADQLDKLVGFLGLGIVPKGSSDPFGLRRAATLLIDAALGWSGNFPSYSSLMDLAISEYAKQDIQIDKNDITEKLSEIFVGRYESMLSDVRYDVLESALGDEQPIVVLSPRTVATRVFVINQLVDDHAFIQTATRPLNILNAARKKDELILPLEENLEQMDSQEGVVLAQETLRAEKEIFGEDQEDNLVDQAVNTLKSLQKPINDFFDSTMVMCDDEDARLQRLLMLVRVERVLKSVGDWTKIVIES